MSLLLFLGLFSSTCPTPSSSLRKGVGFLFWYWGVEFLPLPRLFIGWGFLHGVPPPLPPFPRCSKKSPDIDSFHHDYHTLRLISILCGNWITRIIVLVRGILINLLIMRVSIIWKLIPSFLGIPRSPLIASILLLLLIITPILLGCYCDIYLEY